MAIEAFTNFSTPESMAETREILDRAKRKAEEHVKRMLSRGASEIAIFISK